MQGLHLNRSQVHHQIKVMLLRTQVDLKNTDAKCSSKPHIAVEVTSGFYPNVPHVSHIGKEEVSEMTNPNDQRCACMNTCMPTCMHNTNAIISDPRTPRLLFTTRDVRASGLGTGNVRCVYVCLCVQCDVLRAHVFNA